MDDGWTAATEADADMRTRGHASKCVLTSTQAPKSPVVHELPQPLPESRNARQGTTTPAGHLKATSGAWTSSGQSGRHRASRPSDTLHDEVLRQAGYQGRAGGVPVIPRLIRPCQSSAANQCVGDGRREEEGDGRGAGTPRPYELPGYN
jgi:hypothetical protein